MDRLTHLAQTEPVRLYAVAAAVMAIAAHYFPDIPTVLWLGLVAAFLGIGEEAVRGNVTPVAKLPEVPDWEER
jgi:hypothetical protein